MKFILLSIVYCLLSTVNCFSEDFQVMMQVSKLEQNDSLGGNIVEQLPAFVYKQILNGKVKLWDSPKKEIEINIATLKNIETTSQTKFSQTDKFFLYEIWSVAKKEVQTRTVGFTFMNMSSKHEQVAYGFVDYSDIGDLFKTAKISCNADGMYNTTFEQVVKYKGFNYSIVQYGSQKVTTWEKSQQLKYEIFLNRKLVADVPPADNSKSVLFSIEYTKFFQDESVENSKKLFSALEKFFLENEEELFNIGGDKVTDFIKKKTIAVTKVDVSSVWTKSGDIVSFAPQSITIYVNDTPLNILRIQDVKRWNIVLDFKSLEDFLKEKKLYFVIKQVNEQEISVKDSEKYIKALMSSNWSQLNEVVKEY